MECMSAGPPLAGACQPLVPASLGCAGTGMTAGPLRHPLLAALIPVADKPATPPPLGGMPLQALPAPPLGVADGKRDAAAELPASGSVPATDWGREGPTVLGAAAAEAGAGCWELAMLAALDGGCHGAAGAAPMA